MNQININNLSGGYTENDRVFKNINLSLKTGEVTCLLGENGCGKTTILKSLLGILPVSEGDIKFNNIDILKLNDVERSKILAYIPQAHETPYAFTVEEVVLMGRVSYFNIFSREDKRNKLIARKYMDLVGITDIKDRPYNKLSGGQQQLAIIARALSQESKFLLMDEPTNNLDFGNQYKILDLINYLKLDMNLGVLMVTHDPQHCFYIADNVIILKKGEIKSIGKVDEVLNSKSLTELYGIEIGVNNIKTDNSNQKICFFKSKGEKNEKNK